MSYIIYCSEHGKSAFCYVNSDGTHIDSELCCCYGTSSVNCPVEGHSQSAKRRQAEKERKLREMLKGIN